MFFIEVVAEIGNLMLDFFNHPNRTSTAQVMVHFILGTITTMLFNYLCPEFGAGFRLGN